MAKIVWQYSEEWQRQMGIFRPRPGDEQNPAVPMDEEEPDAESRPILGSGFIPARDKLEAVNRLSSVVGGPPETLSTGSTERKSVLESVARALRLPAEVTHKSKPELAERIAHELGQQWGPDCFSTGSTVTLTGLNVLLEGAQRRFSVDSTAFSSVAAEADAILNILDEVARGPFVGRDAVVEMRESGSANWAQSEWPGFYFEHVAIPACIGRLGGGPKASPGKTVFDYACTFIWDFKAHSDDSNEAILNDQEAIHWALADGGLGFIILTGHPEKDGEFKDWFDQFKAMHGKTPVPRAHPRAFDRRLKSRFEPLAVEAFFFPDKDAWDAALGVGAITAFAQPAQVSGRPRKAKYRIHLTEARVSWLVGERKF